MNTDEIINSVDIDKLYQHVLQLEGVRHAVQNPDNLNKAADYIKREFESYGLAVNDIPFRTEGFDFTYRNIDCVINGGKTPEIIVTSHYDTVRNSPGADDNASACAVMLETARILATADLDKTVRFISFSQEEPCAYLEKQLLEHGKAAGLLDDQYRSKKYRHRSVLKKYWNLRRKAMYDGHSVAESWDKAMQSIEPGLTAEELGFIKKYQELYRLDDVVSFVGKTALVGSNHWAEKAKAANKQINGVINLEMVGYVTKKPGSQKFPPGVDISAFPNHGVNNEKPVGDFICIVSDDRSDTLGQVFFEQCKKIDLPAALLAVPMDITQIASVMPDLLRSDHAPFWKEDYPALMITDTAEFRTPYYHTAADKISTLDFKFMKKVCQATAMAAVES